ncbi:hypothetical protein CCP3SC15_330021 [Gammaproteobacteria bacterium]
MPNLEQHLRLVIDSADKGAGDTLRSLNEELKNTTAAGSENTKVMSGQAEMLDRLARQQQGFADALRSTQQANLENTKVMGGQAEMLDRLARQQQEFADALRSTQRNLEMPSIRPQVAVGEALTQRNLEMPSILESYTKMRPPVVPSKTALEMAGVGGAFGKADAMEAEKAAEGLKKTEEGFKKTEKAADKSAFATVGARRELIVLGHEALTGQFSRMPGSFMVLAERMDATRYLFNPITAGIVAVSAAAFLLGKAFVEASAEEQRMDLALKSTANYAGQTQDSLLELADQMAATGHLTIGEAKDLVTSLAESGQVGANAFDDMAKMAYNFAIVMHKDVDSVVPEMLKVFGDGAKGLETWNQKYHLLSAAQLQHITDLREENKYTEAEAESIAMVGKAISDMAPKLNILQRAWEVVRNTGSYALSGFVGAFSQETDYARIDRLRKAVEADKSNLESPWSNKKHFEVLLSADQTELDSLLAIKNAKEDDARATAAATAAEKDYERAQKMAQSSSDSYRLSVLEKQKKATEAWTPKNDFDVEVKQEALRSYDSQIAELNGKFNELDSRAQLSVEKINQERSHIDSLLAAGRISDKQAIADNLSKYDEIISAQISAIEEKKPYLSSIKEVESINNKIKELELQRVGYHQQATDQIMQLDEKARQAQLDANVSANQDLFSQQKTEIERRLISIDTEHNRELLNDQKFFDNRREQILRNAELERKVLLAQADARAAQPATSPAAVIARQSEVSSLHTQAGNVLTSTNNQLLGEYENIKTQAVNYMRDLERETAMINASIITDDRLRAQTQLGIEMGYVKKKIDLYDEFAGSKADREKKFNELAEANQKRLEYQLRPSYLRMADDWSNTHRQMDQVTEDFFRGASDMLINFVKTGKLGFKDFADTIISELLRIQINRGLAMTVYSMGGSSLMNMLGLSANTPDGAAYQQSINTPIHHEGGVAGYSQAFKQINPIIFSDAHRYHAGGIAGLAPDEVPAILKRGEEVLTAQDPRHIYNLGGMTRHAFDVAALASIFSRSQRYHEGGVVGFPKWNGKTDFSREHDGGLDIVINNHSPSPVTAAKREMGVDNRGRRRVEIMLAELTSEETRRPGGAMHSAIAETFDVNPRLVGR